VEEPEYFTLRIEWDSEEGPIKGFRTNPEFQPFFNDIQEMRHYNITHIRGRKVNYLLARICSSFLTISYLNFYLY
jgi:hypothetical protein